MKRRTVIKGLAAGLPALYLSKLYGRGSSQMYSNAGPFQPTWESLQQYAIPEWFRDAKFGIWAHWGPQCQPERGDWYARGMYEEGTDQYKFHCQKYGHPSKFGFKDVINIWKAEHWNPEELVELYKEAGAKYFVALANHHDNFDLFHSKYQSWNATAIGPKKDLIAGWAKAAKKQGLPFGVSVHASHAWRWYETAQRADKTGQYAGVPYDGNMTSAEGKGKWWEGYDPQELYAQNHPLSLNSLDDNSIGSQWDWSHSANIPSKAYCEKFYNRVIELVDKYEPELLYFDDTVLPLWPISDAGLRIASYFYNSNIKKHGELRAVLTGKILDQQQRKCMVWDIERGQSNRIEPLHWQTDTCIGGWHYDRRIYDNNGYKSAKTVIHALADIVSKNGNLLLNIPVRGDGTIDDKERKIVGEVGAWMKVNSESIYNSRPWKIFGEGPASASASTLNAQGFNEGTGKPFGADDFRFTVKENALYAAMLGSPADNQTLIKALSSNAGNGKVERVSLLGYDRQLDWQQTDAGLKVSLPAQPSSDIASVFKIEGAII
jgi:alpha-L-fucosidase